MSRVLIIGGAGTGLTEALLAALEVEQRHTVELHAPPQIDMPAFAVLPPRDHGRPRRVRGRGRGSL